MIIITSFARVNLVSTLVVEWIEIGCPPDMKDERQVSTLVVEWIEIREMSLKVLTALVSTLVVEWIEIQSIRGTLQAFTCLHPRGGVD